MASSDKMTVVKFFADEDATTSDKLAIAKEFNALAEADADGAAALVAGIRDETFDY